MKPSKYCSHCAVKKGLGINLALLSNRKKTLIFDALRQTYAIDIRELRHRCPSDSYTSRKELFGVAPENTINRDFHVATPMF